MKTLGKLAKLVGGLCVGYLAACYVQEIGYQKGVKDVLKENDIDSFTYKTKRGNSIVYHKPSK